MEAGQGQVDDELLSRYRTQYDNFDAMFQAVRDGTAPAQDIAAQKAVTRWMDRLTYQMNYDEFLSSISSQADVIRRNPLFLILTHLYTATQTRRRRIISQHGMQRSSYSRGMW